jgi:hypothetical protein
MDIPMVSAGDGTQTLTVAKSDLQDTMVKNHHFAPLSLVRKS